MSISRFPYLSFSLQVRQLSYSEKPLLTLVSMVKLWQPVVGPPVLAPVYSASFQIDALGPFPATVTVLGNETLVGLDVIRRFTVTLDTVNEWLSVPSPSSLTHARCNCSNTAPYSSG